MKKQVLMTMIALSAGLFTANSYALDMHAAEAEIKAECVAESKNTENPEIYIEECVADRMQALKDAEGGGVAPTPADRG